MGRIQKYQFYLEQGWMPVKHLLCDLEIFGVRQADCEDIPIPEAGQGSVLLVELFEECLHVTSLGNISKVAQDLVLP